MDIQFYFRNLYMKRFGITAILLLSGFAFLSGCAGDLQTDVSGPDEKLFPASLAGTWKADASNWQITLAPDGTVISAVGKGGMLLPIAQGHLYEQVPEKNEFGYMEFGPGSAEYDPSKQHLKVKIEIERVLMADPNSSLEGKITYYFTGNISDDQNVWYVRWWTQGSFGGVSLAPDEIVYESLVFRKVKNN